LFFDDLLAATNLLSAQLEDALSELAAVGAITSDGFAAMRRLATRGGRRHSLRTREPARRRRAAAHGLSGGGRWSRFPAVPPKVEAAERAERWARQLLARYGVMFRDLLARETCAPPWRELVFVYRRLEMAGEVRGGRFVSRFGEQYALPSAVDRLRRLRDEDPTDEVIILSAADPLNLVGILTAGDRIPALASSAIALLGGQLIASWQSGAFRTHEPGVTASRDILPPDRLVDISRQIQKTSAARLHPDAAAIEQHRLARWELRGEESRADKAEQPEQGSLF